VKGADFREVEGSRFCRSSFHFVSLSKHKEIMMNFLAKLLQGIAFVPAVVQGVEGVFGAKTGATKKAAALSVVQTAVSATDAIANKNVVDPNQFQEGLSKVIDGVVSCLNASVWASKK
jgi:hypothetical protein